MVVQMTESFLKAKLGACFAAGARTTNPAGIGCVVFAHKTTEGWEALLGAMLRVDGPLLHRGRSQLKNNRDLLPAIAPLSLRAYTSYVARASTTLPGMGARSSENRLSESAIGWIVLRE